MSADKAPKKKIIKKPLVTEPVRAVAPTPPATKKRKEVKHSDGFTDLEKRFINHYLRTGDPVRSYISADPGCTSWRLASRRSAALLRRPRVMRRLERIRKQEEETTLISREKLARYLETNIRRSLQEQPVLDANGMPTGMFVYNGANVNKAVQLLAKLFGHEASKRVDVNHMGGVAHLHAHTQIPANELPPETAKQLLELMRARREVQNLLPVKEVIDANSSRA